MTTESQFRNFTPDQELDERQALDLIREIVDTGHIIFSDHARDRMQERNFTSRDVLYILKHGHISKKEFDEEHNNWQYAIKGEDLEGDDGTIVTAIVNSNRQVIITVY